MNGENEVLKAVLSLHEATEMRFNAIDARFDGIDARFEGIDARLEGVDARFDRLEARQSATDTRLDRLERVVHEGFDDMRSEMRAGFAAVNQRIDQFGRRGGSR